MADLNNKLIEGVDFNVLSGARLNRESPMIGVIGATAPTTPYKDLQGFEVGYKIREFLEKNPGTIFTGGVGGVGSDVYFGIVKYCINQGVKTGEIPKDKFFVIVPNGMAYVDFKTHRKVDLPFSLPETYTLLAKFLPKKKIDIVRAGNNMRERRLNLSSLADVLIVVNGSSGTDHEAYTGLKWGKKIIALPYTGGTAQLLNLVRKGEYKIPKREKERNLSRKLFSEQYFIKDLTSDPLDFRLINPELINIANSSEELIGMLKKILYSK